MNGHLFALTDYAIHTGLIPQEDRIWAVNRLLEVMELYDISLPDEPLPNDVPLHILLEALTQNAVERGVLEDNQTARDLFDTKLMGALTPAPHEVRAEFRRLYQSSPKKATD